MHCIITIGDTLSFEKYTRFMERLEQVLNNSGQACGPMPDNDKMYLHYIPKEIVDDISAKIDRTLMKEDIFAEVEFVEETCEQLN